MVVVHAEAGAGVRGVMRESGRTDFVRREISENRLVHSCGAGEGTQLS